MKAFAQLTPLGQIRRLRHLLDQVLPQYGLVPSRVQFLTHFENTTFRITAQGQDYLLRLHRPGYNSPAAIRSELQWLAALSQETDLSVQVPVATLSGDWLASAQMEGLPTARYGTLLSWQAGRHSRKCQPRHLRQLGQLAARLQAHARHWTPPTGFERRSWSGAAFLRLHDTQLWQQIPQRQRGLYREFCAYFQTAEAQLGTDNQLLLHADLHLGNVLFRQGQICPIDFDDCGFGQRIYDLAVVLYPHLYTPDYAWRREALLAGYTSETSLSETELNHLETFIIARSLSVLLWCLERAHEHSFFQKRLRRWKSNATQRIRRFLASAS